MPVLTQEREGETSHQEKKWDPCGPEFDDIVGKLLLNLMLNACLNKTRTTKMPPTLPY